MRSGNFRLPAEWEPHRATWIVWPHPRCGHTGHPHWPHTYRRKAIPRYWAAMAKALCVGEDVCIVSHHAGMDSEIAGYLERESPGFRDHPRLKIHTIPNDWPWIRDSGGFVVQTDDGRRRMIKCKFDAWGGTRWAHSLDDELPRHIARITGMDTEAADFVLEGGAIDVNGAGVLLTTQSCMQRCTHIASLGKHARRAIEAKLRKHLAIDNIGWLDAGIAGDDTGGHIDGVARFLNQSTILAVVETNRKDANYATLSRNLRLLRKMRDQDGKPFTVAELPLPRPIVYRGRRTPASYANFYVGNRAVLVPVFGDPHDRLALTLLQQAFPTRTIVDINARDLVWGLGTFHCLTWQEPELAPRVQMAPSSCDATRRPLTGERDH